MKNSSFKTVAQFVAEIGDGVISKGQVYAEIKAGKIPVTYIGNRVLIPQTYVDQFLNSAKCIEVK